MKTRNPVRNALVLAMGLSFAAASHGAATFDPAKQPYGQLPPLAITGFNLSGGQQKAFQVWFDGNSWAGDVVAYPLGKDGKTDVSARLWSAADVFQARQGCPGSTTNKPTATDDWYSTTRKVVTRNATGANKPFRWASISATQQTSIGDATEGPKILNFIRGDRTNEKRNTVLNGDGTVQYECGASTGTYRARNSILGDVIRARPVFVGAPPADYLFDSYQTFKTNNTSRAPRLYVGANDGMLHAFDANTGEEVWAYVPSMLIAKLKNLTAAPYTHNYFIDGGLTAGDVNFGTTAAPDWRTVLVGGLGAGGKGLFAVDATSPDATNETFAAAKLLWEITPASTGFAELGDTYGDPVIVRLNTGQWAAIVGNGYNNTGNGHAVLYIIDIKTGALIRSLDTGSGTVASPDGLSSPVAIDTNFDGKVDRVYAGDIDGNLWKFDISATTASTWAAPTSPLHTTGGRAIVGAPDVAAHPLNGYIVYFATGRMFTAADGSDSTVVNHAYGIWDGAPGANTAILDQTLTEKSYGALRVRVSSGLPINWNDASNPASKPLHKGWRAALPAGERVLGTGFVRDARYHFSSVNPTVVRTPPPNGENWLNELDYLTGGVGDKLIFDLNSDSLLTDADRVPDSSGSPIAGPTGIAVAVFQGAGLLSQPVLAILSAQLSTTIFNDNPYFSPADQPSDPPPPDTDPGVSGGHFDVDIYNAAGNVQHTHEYDDIFNVTGVNFLAPSDPGFVISRVITTTSTKFKILIAHQKMSPAVSFSYGGLPYQKIVQMSEYTTAGLTMASLPVFDRTTIGTLKYNMPKDAFAVKDWAGNGDLRVGLIPTQTGCVNGGTTGTVGPAPNLLNRNGALLFQLVKDTTPDSAIQLADAAGDPAYGYRVKEASRATYLLAEWSTFWHHPNGKCLGTGWVKDPPMDTSPPDFSKAKTPAAGSSDPPRDQFGSVVSTTTTTTTDPAVSGGTIRTTVTTYSTGAKVIVEEYINSKGKVTKTIITNVPPPSGTPGGAGAGAGGVSQSLAAPNTVTGYQQTRNSGKLGRVSWHELFGQ